MVSKKTYNQLQQELDDILTTLQSTTDVDEALKLQKRGKQAIDQLEAYLNEAQKQLPKPDKT